MEVMRPQQQRARIMLQVIMVLHAVVEAGISVHEYPLDAPVADIQWSGKEKTTVFVRTNKNTIYRSEDEGKTWEKQNLKMDGSQAEEDGKSGVLSMHVSPSDTNKIFFRGASKQHWITTDEGSRYQALPAAFVIKELKIHPTEPQWMLASHLTDGCKKTERVGCQMEVYLTTDMGKTWKLLLGYVAQFEWAVAVDGQFKPGMQKETIFMVGYEQKTGNQPFGVWSAKANFMRSDDLWTTFYTLLPRGNRFLFLDRFLFVAVVNKNHETQVNLYVSSDGGKLFKKARLPFQLTEHSYTILDTSEGSVFLHVNHGDYNTGYGNIYLSDAEGLRFSLSLRNNKRDAQGRCDFEKVQGIEGIYITNQQSNAEAESRAKPQLRTKITFDKGGKWQLLKPPAATNTGKEFSCRAEEDPSCSLHLHGVTDNWGPFYSSKNAIGLVMATGNVGHYLSDKEDEVHTFFSRDAGLTWQMVRAGSHIYEYGDHGAIIVVADDRRASKSIFYSWDEAMTWNELHFTNEPAEIENIVIEPQATSQVFIMYGTRGDAGVLFQIDFSELHEPRCKGVESAGDPGSDYELWSPYDGRQLGGKCLLGHQVRYTRRRRASQCYNGELYERVEFRKNCPCAEEDYECDFGYERSTDGGPCVAIMSMSNAAPKDCHGSYSISNGYRLVAGDTCDPTTGVDHMPTVFRCPGMWSGSVEVSSSGWVVLFILMGLLGVLGYVTFKNRGLGGLTLQDILELIPREMPSLSWPPWASSRGKYRPVPESALDDELDLGDEEEAEELHDADMYAYENPNRTLGTLPAPRLPSPELYPPKAAEGNLLGDLGDASSKKGS